MRDNLELSAGTTAQANKAVRIPDSVRTNSGQGLVCAGFARHANCNASRAQV